MRDKIKLFKKNGYLLLENLISEKKCLFYKKKLNEYYDKYSSKYAQDKNSNSLSNKTNEKVVYNLHNKDYFWFELFENKKVKTVLDILLKEGSYQDNEPYYLANISARCPLQFNKGQQLHVDNSLPGINYNLSVNVLWMIDDFTKHNGPTRILPRSHLLKKYATNGKVYKNEKLITAKKGSALIFNTSLWHGGSRKDDVSSRWAIILGYYRWYLKPSFDYIQNTPNNIYKKMTKEQKRLLGFDVIPPRDEFTRVRRRSINFEKPNNYKLPFNK